MVASQARTKRRQLEDLACVHPNAAGLDIGSEMIVAVPPDRDPQPLAVFRQPGCKHSEAEIVKALTGTWADAQLFILRQSVDVFDYYTTKLIACDAHLEQQYQAMESHYGYSVQYSNGHHEHQSEPPSRDFRLNSV